MRAVVPDQIDWRLVNSFSGWLSALGTVLAVVVALYLARRDNLIRLSVRASLRTQWVQGGGPGHGDRFVSINVVNRGRRVATITGLGWRTGYFWRRGFCRRREFLQLPPFSTPIPTKLEDGDEAGYLFPIEHFLDGADDIATELRRRPFSTLRARTLRVMVRTGAGKSFSARATRELRDEIVQRGGEE